MTRRSRDNNICYFHQLSEESYGYMSYKIDEKKFTRKFNDVS